MNFTYILIFVLIIIIIICIIENCFYKLLYKYSFKCPNTYEVFILNDGNKLLIYNTETMKKDSVELVGYKYTYEPKILMTTKLLNPIKQSVKKFKNIDKDTPITDTIDGVIPYVNYFDSVFNMKSKYKVLTNEPNLKITSDESYIYVKKYK